MQKTIKYYSFQEVLVYFMDEGSEIPSSPNQRYSPSEKSWFMNLVSDANYKLNLVGFKASSTIIPQATIGEFISELIDIVYNRHANDYIAEVIHSCLDVVDEQVDRAKAADMAMNKLINVINLTAPRYVPILLSYVNNYEDPIKMLESISESFSRFNDTPQNEIDEVDYNTPAYATNMGKNKSISKVDSGSVIDRLNSLIEKFRSIILDWSNEFNQLFLNDLQLEY